MTASALDRTVQFRRATLVDDGFGTVEVWDDHGSPVWAMRTDIRDVERWQAGQVQASVTTRFQVRSSEFTRDIDPTDRLTCEGREFNITGVKQAGGRRQLIEITASASATQ